jgi:hypothetical protein
MQDHYYRLFKLPVQQANEQELEPHRPANAFRQLRC